MGKLKRQLAAYDLLRYTEGVRILIAFFLLLSVSFSLGDDLLKRALNGNPLAQKDLGDLYFLGSPNDYVEASKWYRRAAEQGNAEAQFCMGSCYFFGWGVKKDMLESVKWYRKAAEQGNAKAQRTLGNNYALGWGVPKNDVEAYAYYTLAGVQYESVRIRRDDLEKLMSAEQIAAGQKRAKELQKEIEAKMEGK